MAASDDCRFVAGRRRDRAGVRVELRRLRRRTGARLHLDAHEGGVPFLAFSPSRGAPRSHLGLQDGELQSTR